MSEGERESSPQDRSPKEGSPRENSPPAESPKEGSPREGSPREDSPKKRSSNEGSPRERSRSRSRSASPVREEAAEDPEEIKAKVEDDEYDQKPEKEKEYTDPIQLEVLPQPSLPPRLDKLWYGRLPVHAESKPFDSLAFDPSSEVHNDSLDSVMRWRWVERDGNYVRESNSRIVRWSDGSWNLFVGGESYNITEQVLDKDHTYLYARHRKFLKAEGQLTSKIVVRPSDIASRTQKISHLAQKHAKSRRVKLIITDNDPEQERELRERQLESIQDSQETLSRKQSKKRRLQQAEESLTAQMLEQDEDDMGREDADERHMPEKKKRKRLIKKRDYEESEEEELRDEEEEEGEVARPPVKSKFAHRRRGSSQSITKEDSDDEGEEDEEEEEDRRKSGGLSKRRKLKK